MLRSRSATSPSLLVAIALALAVCACSSGDTGSDHADDPIVFTGVDTERPGVEGGDPVTGLIVDTGVSDDSPAAGQPITVYCPVEGAPAGAPEPATSWALQHVPTPLTQQPVISGDDITFLEVGVYHIVCKLVASGWTDPTPAVIHVGAGDALEVNTAVSPKTVPVGDTATITCTGHDGWDNPVDPSWEVYASGAGDDPGPDGGVIVVNQTLTALTVGTYDVACAHATGKIDPTPVRVTVVVGLPERLIASLSHPVISAGQASAVTCRAEDAYGNEIDDFPMSIDVDAVLGFQGFAVSGTQAGTYTITCVPVGLNWTDFELVPALLEIKPAHPVSLEMTVQPPKPYFALTETVQLAVLAHDSYGNAIPDVGLSPIQVVPGDAHEWLDDLALAFDAEGFYEITASVATNPALTATVEVAVEGQPPVLTVTYPKRGATIAGFKPSVTVEGTANDTVAGIDSVLVNGIPATVHDDGTWTAILIAKWGLNVIEVVTYDGAGQTDSLLQSFYFAELYHKMSGDAAYVPNGLQQYLSEKAIDDGVHTWGDPDDMATILEQTLLYLNTQQLAPEPLEIGLGYELKLWNITTSVPSLTLDPRDGGLDVAVDYDLWTMSVALENDCGGFFIDICPDVYGTMSVQNVQSEAVLWASATDGDLDVQLTGVSANVGFIDLSIDGLSTVLQLLGLSDWGWLIEIIVDVIANLFAGTIEGQLAGGLGDALETQFIYLLEDMTLHESYVTQPLLPGLGLATFQFDTELDSLHFTEDGGRVGFGARVLSSKQVYGDIEGSIGRGTCLKGFPLGYSLPGEKEFEAAYKDDVINGVLTSVWRAGALNGVLDMTAFPVAQWQSLFEVDAYPVTDLELDTTLSLPPIFNACLGDDLTLIQVGDMYLAAEVHSEAFAGGVGHLGAYLSFELGAGIDLVDSDWEDKVGMSLGSLISVAYHWEQIPPSYEGDTEPLEAFIEDLFIKGLLAEAIAPLGNFAVHGLGFAESVPGIVAPPEVKVLFRDNGHTAAQGILP